MTNTPARRHDSGADTSAKEMTMSETTPLTDEQHIAESIRRTKSRQVWLFKGRVTLGVGYYPMWDLANMGVAEVRTNGWRIGYSCLDMTLRIGKLNFNAVFWSMPFQRNMGHWQDDD